MSKANFTTKHDKVRGVVIQTANTSISLGHTPAKGFVTLRFTPKNDGEQIQFKKDPRTGLLVPHTPLKWLNIEMSLTWDIERDAPDILKIER